MLDARRSAPAAAAVAQRCGTARRRCGAAVHALLVLALAAGFRVVAEAKVTYTQVYRDDRRLIRIAPDFAFADEGRIEIVIKDITIWRKHGEDREVVLDDMGVLTAPAYEGDLVAQLPLMDPKACLVHERESTLFTLQQHAAERVVSQKANNATFVVDVEEGGWLSIYWANCDGAAVSFRAVVSAYSVLPGGRRDYLSVGETELDVVYWVMFGLFSCLTAAWAVALVRRRDVAHRVHLLMGALVLFKALTLLAQALMTMHVERTGLADGWNYAYYVFTAARGLLFFTVVVLIGAGWSYMKPFLDDNTRKTLLVVVPLQVVANIALVFVDEESPAMRDWLAWRNLFHLVDIVCCCAILLPIVWQIRHLREAATVDGKAARSLAKLRLFRSFYIVVVGYVYVTRIVVYMLRNLVDYRYEWTSEAVSEISALAFYTWVGVSFRPARENAYLQVTQEDIELATAY